MDACVISVVTPSFNQGRYIEETIQSVLSQEGDFELDYIIADGGSTDGSVEIIRRYDRLIQVGRIKPRCRGLRYRWVSEQDKGQTDAIEKGFGMAEGQVLAWLNSDDIYRPGALGRVASYFRDHPQTNVLYGDSEFVTESGDVVGRYPTEPFDHQRLAVFNFICQPSTFFSREVFEKAGGMNPDLHYVMDYDLWIRLADGVRFVYLPEVLSRFRVHGSSKSVSARHAVENFREALQVVHVHYRWAPLSRVYGYVNNVCRMALPPALARHAVVTVPLSLIGTVFKYLWMNRGVRIGDMKMLTPSNLRKLRRSWSELMIGR